MLPTPRAPPAPEGRDVSTQRSSSKLRVGAPNGLPADGRMCYSALFHVSAERDHNSAFTACARWGRTGARPRQDPHAIQRDRVRSSRADAPSPDNMISRVGPSSIRYEVSASEMRGDRGAGPSGRPPGVRWIRSHRVLAVAATTRFPASHWHRRHRGRGHRGELRAESDPKVRSEVGESHQGHGV